MRKRPTTKTLRRKLDDAFSLMVKMRDSDLPCISCGQHKDEYQAGHFIKRQKIPTRWHPWNVHAQCIYCNNFDETHGVGYKYGRAIEFGYGEGTVDALERLSVVNWKPQQDQLVRLIDACHSPDDYEHVWFAVQQEFAPELEDKNDSTSSDVYRSRN